MQVTAAMVKELRDKSGAGMSACKNALVDANGDMERAGEILREKGLTAAAKKSGRIAAEGIVAAQSSDDRKTGVLVEINIETDFAAKNSLFRDFAAQVANQVMESEADGTDELLAEQWAADASITVKDALMQKIAVIGENINIRRFEKYVACCGGAVVQYVHGGGKVAVMAQFNTDIVDDAFVEAGKNICMQIAAMSPKFVSRSDMSEEFIAKEKEILTQLTINEGKPANIAGKIVEGRLAKSLKDYCLIEQEYVKDAELTVEAYLKKVSLEIGSEVSVKRFVRFETG
ncbi:MAG: translation elongation factor Ts, partial [Defluviitaleaceae bacterium]|nr:translation elongation factor Ts [Defluviitaleaceae bacterium]